MSKKNITLVERLADGSVIHILPDGSRRVLEDKTDWQKLRAMTDVEIEGDVDNPLLTNEDLKHFKRVPNPKDIRLHLHMTQEQFASQFQVPLGTLRDWEQGAKTPDAAARSYLRVIEKAPHIVIQALNPHLPL